MPLIACKYLMGGIFRYKKILCVHKRNLYQEATMTKEKEDRLKARHLGLSVKEYRRRRDELVRQVEIIREGKRTYA